MNEMMERVKAAIAEKYAPAIDHKAPYAKVMLDMAARAAIEAMAKGPTDEMTKHETYTSGQWSRRNYEAIFAAALSPSREDEG